MFRTDVVTSASRLPAAIGRTMESPVLARDFSLLGRLLLKLEKQIHK